MRICDKCKSLLTIEMVGFKGEFLDFFELNPVEICMDCSPGFKKLFEDYLGISIQEAKPLPSEEHRIFEGRKNKK